MEKSGPPCRESLGLRIINVLAKRDLHGTVEMRDANPGCRVEITFPL
jgi:two-component sensor histidine kinase